MKIQILQLLEGAEKASGLTVIIDVFRAFSVACYAYGQGVEVIYPVGNIEEAYRLKKEHSEYILVGEREEQKPEGFDFGNSPSQLLKKDIFGKTMIHTTSSGTQGIASANNASEIITGSFVNAEAITDYIRLKNPEILSLVCMGYSCRYPVDEDTFFAEYIRDSLEGRVANFENIKDKLKRGSGARFFAPSKQKWAPKEDFNLCLDLNRFPFVLKVEKQNGRNYLRKITQK
ncbi:MAG: 2-phosphosulfolactate phosphatase [Prolixibacteraceae bacterium]|nr:2-phosphosulfolactate phosphatase [Prolixibacteraceae bacterium]